jgi:hypothetical protein
MKTMLGSVNENWLSGVKELGGSSMVLGMSFFVHRGTVLPTAWPSPFLPSSLFLFPVSPFLSVLRFLLP